MNCFKQKRVLVTGHTGFKGSWLCIWLKHLGAEVHGLSDKYVSEPNMYQIIELNEHVENHIGDVRDVKSVCKLVNQLKPDYIFHLAAQPVVTLSYENPVETFSTNALGTLSVLEALRLADFETTCVFITSDKVYDNLEWLWGYKETDRIGGSDPYSASKGMAELAIASYYKSFFCSMDNLKIAVGRAGNVIGGGDWAMNRIVPDLIRSWDQNKTLSVRSPNSTRPWQHVLEPISGYLKLAEALEHTPSLSGEAFNFGPNQDVNEPVSKLLDTITGRIDNLSWEIDGAVNTAKEAVLLKLNCEKAQSILGWRSKLTFDQTINMTTDWYIAFYEQKTNMLDFSLKQLSEYAEKP